MPISHTAAQHAFCSCGFDISSSGMIFLKYENGISLETTQRRRKAPFAFFLQGTHFPGEAGAGTFLGERKILGKGAYFLFSRFSPSSPHQLPPLYENQRVLSLAAKNRAGEEERRENSFFFSHSNPLPSTSLRRRRRQGHKH